MTDLFADSKFDGPPLMIMQQALNYASILDIPVAFSSNGDGFLLHDRSGLSKPIEKNLTLDQFPSPQQLWLSYKQYKGLKTPQQEQIATFDYFYDGSGKSPRYYQQIAINRTVEAIAKGQNRILLVMATGTGKTYTAFQIIYRLWKNGVKKRILFLADRNILIDQTKRNDFKHFKDKMTVSRPEPIISMSCELPAMMIRANGKWIILLTPKNPIRSLPPPPS